MEMKLESLDEILEFLKDFRNINKLITLTSKEDLLYFQKTFFVRVEKKLQKILAKEKQTLEENKGKLEILYETKKQFRTLGYSTKELDYIIDLLSGDQNENKKLSSK